MLPGGWVISHFLGGYEHWKKFWVGKGAWVKMPRFSAFNRNVSTINVEIFPTHRGRYKFERKFNKYSGERESSKEFIEIWNDVSLRLILKDKDGIYTVYHIGDFNNLRAEISSKKTWQQKNVALK